MKELRPSGRRTAIIVPPSTHLNPGDQALVWEAVRLIEEAALADDVLVLDVEESARDSASALPAATELRVQWLPPLLRHPRRGRHRRRDAVKESRLSLVLMTIHGLRDLAWGTALLWFAPVRSLALMLLDAPQRRTYCAFREANVVVVKGGGFLHSYGGFSAGYYTWFVSFYLKLAQRLRKPLIILPNSYGPFVGFGVRRQNRQVLSKCQFVCARESLSSKSLGEVLGEEVPVFPDMGYYLQPAKRQVGEQICRQFGVPLGVKPCVAFTLRPYRFPGMSNPKACFLRYLDAMGQLIKHVGTRGFHPVLITHTRGPGAHENDRFAIEQARELLGQVEHSWVDFAGTCREIKSVYACMDYLVGTRFHSVIFAQSAGIPCLAISYGGNKAKGIMADMGLSDYVIPIEQVTGEVLCSMFDSLTEKAHEVREKLTNWEQGLTERRAAMVQQILSALHNYQK